MSAVSVWAKTIMCVIMPGNGLGREEEIAPEVRDRIDH